MTAQTLLDALQAAAAAGDQEAAQFLPTFARWLRRRWNRPRLH